MAETKEEQFAETLTGNLETGVVTGYVGEKVDPAPHGSLEEETAEFKRVTDESVLPEAGDGEQLDDVEQIVHVDAD